MHLHLRSLSLLAVCLAPAAADFLGPRYVYPKDLNSDKSAIPATWKNITAELEASLNNADVNATFGGVAGIKNVTFSLGLFSLQDPDVCNLQFHYTGPEIASQVNGTSNVDGDSIYKLASITKVFTVLTYLLRVNETQWNTPLTEIFPFLKELISNNTSPEDAEVLHIQWGRITPRSLTAQIAGLPTNPLELDSLVSYITEGSDPTLDGLPPWSLDDPLVNPPGGGAYTNITAFLPSLANRAPVFLPWGHPIYSNNGFILLTAALEALLGQDYSSVLRESVLEPLGLNSIFAGLVPESDFNRTVQSNYLEWIGDPGIAVGSGGISASLNDLSKFGVSILNSTLLPAEKTREWLKPVSNTARFQFQLGRPWEILRYTHSSGAVTDLYTKSGQSGTADSYLVLLPDYNAGFNIIASSNHPNRSDIVHLIGDLVSASIVPALELQAAAEAAANFAGEYVATTEGLNSSLTLSLNETEGAAPGLLVESFINNGSDIATNFPTLFKSARLVPSIVQPGSSKIAFRIASAGDAPMLDKSKGLFTGFFESDALLGDGIAYAGVSLSLFTAEVDESGKAKSITAEGFKVKLEKKE